MIDGKRVVAWTPWGRRPTASILVEYLKRDHALGIVDEYWPYLNVGPGQDDDLAYAHELAAAHDWIVPKERPADCPHMTPLQRNTGYAYRYMTDPDSIYIRLDDDIVYIHPAAMARLARAKIQQPFTTACFALIWNNALCTHFLQAMGVVPKEWGDVRPYCMDANGWANGEFAVKMHTMLLDAIERDTVNDLYLYQDVSLQIGQQFSVSCFASAGRDYAALPDGPGVLVPDEEEFWHTVYKTQDTGAPNVIIGNALVSHYSFGPQHGVLYPSNVLDRYRELAATLNQEKADAA
jgi:hypothetical protein